MDIKSLRKDDEEIWWEGSPDRHALNEEYYKLRFLSLIVLLLSGFLGLLVGSAFFQFNLFLAFMWGTLFFSIGGAMGFYMLLDAFRYRHYQGVLFFITSKRIVMVNKGRKRKGGAPPLSGSKLYFFRDVLIDKFTHPHAEEGIAYVKNNEIKSITVVPARQGYNVYFILSMHEQGHWFKFEQVSDITTLKEVITNNLGFKIAPNIIFNFKNLNGMVELYQK